MAKKTLTPSTVATDNIQNQPDVVVDDASALKLSFDQYGIDDKTYTNDVHLAELADETLGNSGSNTIGHNSTNVVADNVGDGLEEVALQVKSVSPTLDIISVLDYGVVGDGSDETTALQNAIDVATAANKTLYVPHNITITTDALLISGKNNFGLQIDGTLKRKDSAPSTTMLVIISSSDFHIYNFNGDANIANNGGNLNEQQHLLAIDQCTDFTVDRVNGVNVAGDVMYLIDVTRGQFGTVSGVSTDTGRNTVSIIKANTLQFDKIISKGVGTDLMPGGVDLEPNLVTDDIKNIQFGSIYVEGKGTAIMQLSNNFGSTCENITIDSLICLKTNSDDATSRFSLAINGFNNVKINGSVRENITILSTNTTGVIMNDCDNVDLDLDIQNVTIGYRLGTSNNINNVRLKGTVKNILGKGLDIIFTSNCVFEQLKVEECAVGGGNNSNIHFDSGGTTTNLLIVDSSSNKITTGFNAVFQAGTVDMRCVNFEQRGWPGLNFTFGQNAMTIKREHCYPLQYQSTTPSAALYWNVGEFVENVTPTVLGTGGSQYTILGWERLTNGVANVLNTDWVEVRVLTGT